MAYRTANTLSHVCVRLSLLFLLLGFGAPSAIFLFCGPLTIVFRDTVFSPVSICLYLVRPHTPRPVESMFASHFSLSTVHLSRIATVLAFTPSCYVHTSLTPHKPSSSHTLIPPFFHSPSSLYTFPSLFIQYPVNSFHLYHQPLLPLPSCFVSSQPSALAVPFLHVLGRRRR